MAPRSTPARHQKPHRLRRADGADQQDQRGLRPISWPLNDDDGCGLQASPAPGKQGLPFQPPVEEPLSPPQRLPQPHGRGPVLPSQTDHCPGCCAPERECHRRCDGHRESHRHGHRDRGEPDGHRAQHRHGPCRPVCRQGPAAPGKGLAAPPAVHGASGGQGPPPLLACLLYTSPSPRDRTRSRMPSSA